MHEAVQGPVSSYDCTITSALLGKPLPAPFQNGMRFGWLLLADTQTFPLAPAGSGRLCRHFLVHRFMAQLQAVSLCSPNMFRQTALGPCRHLLVRLLRSRRAEFLGQKGLVKSGTRRCEEQSVVGFIHLV